MLGVQLFGSFQKIMMLPQPSFKLATNWLLEVLLTPQKIANVNLPIQKRHILSLDLTFDIPWSANGRQWFSGGPKHFQESVGGQFITWSWLFEVTQKLHPYCISINICTVYLCVNARDSLIEASLRHSLAFVCQIRIHDAWSIF